LLGVKNLTNPAYLSTFNFIQAGRYIVPKLDDLFIRDKIFLAVITMVCSKINVSSWHNLCFL